MQHRCIYFCAMNFIQAYIIPFLAVFALCLIPFFGWIYKIIPPERIHKFVPFALAMASGILLGNAFFHLIPESLEQLTSPQNVMVAVVAGIITFFTLEKIVVWKKTCGGHNPVSKVKSMGMVNLSGDALHNFIDGALIAGSFLVNTETGVAVLISVIIHELPQEIGDTGALLYSGLPLKRAVRLNILASLSAVPGAACIFLIHGAGGMLLDYLLPFTAGAFVYMSLANMVPVLLKDRNIKIKYQVMQIMTMIIGIAFIIILNSSTHHHFPSDKKPVKFMGGFDDYLPLNKNP